MILALIDFLSPTMLFASMMVHFSNTVYNGIELILSTPLIFSVTFTDEELTTFSSTDTGTFYRFEFDILERGTLLTFIPRSDQNETTASNSVSLT